MSTADESIEPTDAELEAVSERLRLIAAEHGTASAVKEGLYILDKLYRGRFDLFKSRDPFKPNSLSRLAVIARRSVTTLSDRVRIAEQYPRLDAPFRDQISPSHHVELLDAPPIERNQLCRQAAVQALTVRQLRRLIHPDERPLRAARRSKLARLLDDRPRLLAEVRRDARDPRKKVVTRKELLALAEFAAEGLKTLDQAAEAARQEKKRRSAQGDD